MMKKKRYKRYSPEFKREALLRASEEGATVGAALAANFPCNTVAPGRPVLHDISTSCTQNPLSCGETQ